MFNLILKDILIQKKIVLLSFAYIVFFIIAMQGAGIVMYSTALTAVTYMLVLTSCAYDEKNKADMMLNSLPLKRSSIVMAKYLSVTVYIAIGSVGYWVTTTLIALAGLPLKVYPLTLEGLAGGIFAIGLIISIYFPFYFKFGYIKTKVLNLILFFSIFFGLTGMLNLLYVHKESDWAQSITGFLKSQTELQIFAAIGVLILIMLVTSFGLSLKAYQGRDL